MHITRVTFLIIIFSTLFFACHQSSSKQYSEEALVSAAVADSTGSGEEVSGIGGGTSADSGRQFIRTADLRFRVQDVARATYDIEDIVSANRGYVSQTNLNSSQDQVTRVAVSEDSILETTWYTVSNNMTIRIPNTRLDTALKLMAANIQYLDYRLIRADDVTLQFLSNAMAGKRQAASARRLSNLMGHNKSTLKDLRETEESLTDRESQTDQSYLDNKLLNDQVQFSTIQLQMYQRQAATRELLPNDKNIAAYEPGFGKKFAEAFQFGWHAFQEIILFLVKLWGLILIGLLLYIIARYGWRLLKLAGR